MAIKRTKHLLQRNKLTALLSNCTPKEIDVFKRMYSPEDLSLAIPTIVNNMSTDKLAWALTQVENTLKGRQTPSQPLASEEFL